MVKLKTKKKLTKGQKKGKSIMIKLEKKKTKHKILILRDGIENHKNLDKVAKKNIRY